jgi:DSF synthase
MGVVDVLAADGAGEASVYGFIKKHSKAPNGRRAIEMTSRSIDPLSYEELLRVVAIWVDAALRLSERDMRMMDRLVRAQNRNAQLEVVTDNVMPLQRTA